MQKEEKKIRLLCVNNGLAGGGAEKLLNDLLPRLSRKGVIVTLLILSGKDEKYLSNIREKGVIVDIIPDAVKGHINKIKFIKSYINKNSFDIVHANCFPSFYYCSIAKKISKAFPKLVLTEHNTDNKRRHSIIFRPIEKWIYRSYDVIISISEDTQTSLLNWISPKDDSKFTIIENGVPLEDFMEALPYEKVDLGECIKKEDVLISMVARFFEQKNHELAIDILDKLPEKYKLILVGEGELRARIQKIVRDKNLENRVMFLGFRTDVSRIVKTCDISLIPSKWEGFGLVAVEAMAAGKPVIASNVAGLREIVSDNGFVCNSVDEYIEAIRYLDDQNHYNEYCKKSLYRSKFFSIEKMAGEYLDIYESVIEV